jgi:hypothetical protein
VGIDFSKYSDGGSADPTLSGAVSLVYRASRLWNMRASVNRSTQANPVETDAFDELTSFQVAYTRKILRASWMIGASYQMDKTESADTTSANSVPNQNFLSISTSVTVPLFSNTCNASLFFTGNDQGGEESSAFNSAQVGLKILCNF